MYIVLPLLFRLASSRRAIVSLLALIVAFSGLALIVERQAGPPFILSYVPCFLSGVLAYRLRHTSPFLPSALWPFFVILWIALRAPVRGPIGLSGWLATVLLGAVIYCFHDSTNLLWNGAMRIIARYSYGVYLAHIPAMWLVFYVLPVNSLAVSILLWLAGTAAGAVCAYHLLEEPMINAGRAISNRLLPEPRLDPVPVGQF
jgi:peptidoglycan/LPS O-acetylase OafA/YrhL